jgi:hypothetical protein
MRLACDRQVSFKTMDKLENHGHKVVVWAGHDPDAWWFEKGRTEGAEVFISADSDIDYMAHNAGIPFIKLPHGLGGKDMAFFLIRRLNKIARKLI